MPLVWCDRASLLLLRALVRIKMPMSRDQLERVTILLLRGERPGDSLGGGLAPRSPTQVAKIVPAPGEDLAVVVKIVVKIGHKSYSF